MLLDDFIYDQQNQLSEINSSITANLAVTFNLTQDKEIVCSLETLKFYQTSKLVSTGNYETQIICDIPATLNYNGELYSAHFEIKEDNSSWTQESDFLGFGFMTHNLNAEILHQDKKIADLYWVPGKGSATYEYKDYYRN